MFGTDDVIYVPENHMLVFDDLFAWKRYKLDLRKYGLRIRPDAFEEVANRIRATLHLVKESPRFVDSAGAINENVAAMLHDLTRFAGQGQEAFRGRLEETFRTGEAAWWVRVSDTPPETFFDEDYERSAEAAGNTTPYFTYGSVHVAQLDGLVVELTGDATSSMPEGDEGQEGGVEADVLPFMVDVPPGGLERYTIPPTEPLALTREFCGVHGASAWGHTINLTTLADIAESHQFCTPLGRVGAKLYATLYMHIHAPAREAKVLGRLREEQVFPAAELLEASGFALLKEGPTYRIYEREGGDVVHLYSQLPGKETEGFRNMPPFLVVASAAGEYDPMHRAELYEAIREALGR